MDMGTKQTRRKLLKKTGTALAASALAGSAPRRAAAQVLTTSAPGARPANEPFGYCLNTSTISGANLTIIEELEIASKAGYHAVEPWIREITDYQKKGGSLKDLAKRIVDLGLTIEDAIGFDEWIVDDDARRAQGMESLKLHMDIVAQIGGKRVAAPAIGAQKPTDPLIDLHKVADRYRAVLELGDKMGVQPLIELWGPSKNLHTLAEVAFVAIEVSHPKSSMLLDFYHLHRGGSDFVGLNQLNGAALHVIHANDYPDKPRESLIDANRVYPGDGVAPFGEIFRTLVDIDFHGFLSLELFNRDYWKLSPLKVAQTGLNKMKEVVKRSLG
jgi:sugar phosphate isomerase/epimerase